MKTYIAYIFFTISGLILMKLGGGQMNIAFKDGVFNMSLGIKLIFAFIMYGTSFLLWTGIVAKNDLGYIVPLTSAITNIITVIIGILIFSESINIYKIFGIVLATVGVILMNI